VFLNLFYLPPVIAYSFWAFVLAVDLSLLYRYFKNRSEIPEEKTAVPVSVAPQQK